jgi:hypothetical protein
MSFYSKSLSGSWLQQMQAAGIISPRHGFPALTVLVFNCSILLTMQAEL